MKKPVYRINEFCELYSISRSSLYREIAAGRIRVFKRGRTTLISHAAAQRWLGVLSKTQPAAKTKRRNRCRKTSFFKGFVFFFFRNRK